MFSQKILVQGYVCLTVVLLVAIGAAMLLHPASHIQLGDTRSIAPVFSGAANVSAPLVANAEQSSRARVAATYGKLPLSFELNQGQSDRQVRFMSRGSGYSLFLTSTEAVLALHKTQPKPKSESKLGSNSLPPAPPQAEKSAVVRMKLAGANRSPKVTGVDELPGKSNYFIGNDPKKWRTDVPNYAKVKYENVYPGVDLVYYGHQGQTGVRLRGSARS